MFNNLRVKIVRPTALTAALIVLTGFIFMGFSPSADGHHTQLERLRFAVFDLSDASGQYMGASGLCVQCHDTDPNGVALVDSDGNNVSPVNDWRATLMANSAKDPFWKAKVRHEILETPSLANDIENTCTACHAPQGHNEFHMTGAGSHYTMAYLADDELGLDGVGCIGCHSIENQGLTSSFNGTQPYSDQKIAYGGFTNPWGSPMITTSGFAPVFSEHVRTSELCAGCHSLFVNSVEADGTPTGITFFEQATYHEWLNSDYEQEGIECQNCHMPESEGVKVSSEPTWLQPRTFGKHYLVGGNSFMLKLMKANAEVLGISANDAHFDTVIARTEDLLQNQSMELEVEHIETANDTAVFSVLLTNLAGHKFPSGYPSRVLTVEFEVRNANDEVLFKSGGFDADYNILGRNTDWEPHYDVIRASEEVQIYEMVVADSEGNPTQVLERAHTLLKDNRLTPRGFTTSHSAYDTTRIAGVDESDLNFNVLDGLEGSGTDRIEYRVFTDGYDGEITVVARAWYQSIPKQWVADMFEWDDPEINSFEALFDAADHTPVLVKEASLQSTTGVTEAAHAAPLAIYPNPSRERTVSIRNLPQGAHVYRVYGINGREVVGERPVIGNTIELPETASSYLVAIRATNSEEWRIVRVIRY